MANELKTDPMRDGRRGVTRITTGYVVRACRGASWVSADIAELDALSLLTWLRSRPDVAVNVLGAMLGHGPRLSDTAGAEAAPADDRLKEAEEALLESQNERDRLREELNTIKGVTPPRKFA